MLAPGLGDVLLDSASGRSVIVETSDGAVDFERRDEKETALEDIVESRTESLLVGARSLASGCSVSL